MSEKRGARELEIGAFLSPPLFSQTAKFPPKRGQKPCSPSSFELLHILKAKSTFVKETLLSWTQKNTVSLSSIFCRHENLFVGILFGKSACGATTNPPFLPPRCRADPLFLSLSTSFLPLPPKPRATKRRRRRERGRTWTNLPKKKKKSSSPSHLLLVISSHIFLIDIRQM